MTYATFADVRTRYERDLPDSMQPYVEALLAEAEAVLLQRVPAIPVMLAASPPKLTAGQVAAVEVRPVLRMLRNPSGYYSETSGDYTYRVSRAAMSGDLDYSPQDLALLLGGPSGHRARTVALRPPSAWQQD